jgi:hypothetical protein
LRVLASLVLLILLMTASYLTYGILVRPKFLDSIYLVAVTFALGMGVYHFSMLVLSVRLADGTGADDS